MIVAIDHAHVIAGAQATKGADRSCPDGFEDKPALHSPIPHPEMYAELADASSKLVVMHSILRHGRGTREVQDPAGVLASIYAFFENRLPALEAAGVSRSRLIIDPGMGFFLGGNPEPSLRVLRELRRLKATFGLPMLVSVSRKSFLGAITGRDVHERGAASLAAELFCAWQGTDYIRTHDVR